MLLEPSGLLVCGQAREVNIGANRIGMDGVQEIREPFFLGGLAFLDVGIEFDKGVKVAI